MVDPTPEQRAAMALAQSETRLAIHAFAGTGKTTTLRLLAEALGTSALYIAFNRAVAIEARSKFPVHVDCRTIHSLAFRSIVGRYGGDRLGRGFSAHAFAARLPQRAVVLGEGGRALRLDPVQQASIVLRTVRAFCQSADREILPAHVPTTGRFRELTAAARTQLNAWACRAASMVWERIIDPSRGLPIDHDCYLKIWALGNPTIDTTAIYLDEAQDTNPVVLDLLTKQPSRITLVGDPHQQIYAWRGAVDAMAMFGGRTTYLTETFRFGPAIAAAATAVLRTLGEPRSIISNCTHDSSIVPGGPARAILSRTNTTLIYVLLKALEKDRKVCLLGGSTDLLAVLYDVRALQSGRPASGVELFGFRNWQEVVGWSQIDEGRTLRPLVSIVGQYGIQRLINSVNAAHYTEEQADLVLATAHKAKGREWPSVRVMSDFLKFRDGVIDRSEIRLFYVAITRAQQTLVVDPKLLGEFSR